MRTHSAFRAKSRRNGQGFGAASLLMRRMRRAFILVTVFSVALSPYFPTVQEASADTYGDGSIDSTVEINDSTTNGPTLADGDRYGRAVADIGDLDGDGVQDIAVGAQLDDGSGSNRGAVYIQFMDSDGSVKSTVKIDDTTTNGPSLADGDFYGRSVTGLGDLDGDGVQDIAVGADNDDGSGSDRGAVHIHFMNSNGSIKSTVEINDTTTNGPTLANGDFYGFGVANIGDLDGDGVQDIAVGAFGDDEGGNRRGAVHISFLDTDGSVKSTVEINDSTTNGPTLADEDWYGISVANIDDLDGDGVQDIAVGARFDDGSGSDRGAVHIHFMDTDGSVKSTVEINDTTTNGPTLANDDLYGISVANIGDLDGDGVQDIAAGASSDDGSGSNRGAVHISFMNSNGSVKSTVEINDTTTNGPTLVNGDEYGISVANIGDLDGDGLQDLAVGAHRDDGSSSDRGAVYIHFMTALAAEKTTSNALTFSRLKAGATNVDFSMEFTLQGTDTGALVVTFPSGFTVTGAFTTGNCSGGGTLDTFSFTENTLRANKESCSGTVTVSGAKITNPSSAGQYTITWTNDEGSATVFIVDDDQVSVTAQVAEDMTFDLDTGTTTGNDSAAPYTVALGTLTSGSVTTSGDGTVHMIGIDVDTNATGGAVVQVKNANGANGLVSTSVSGDTIPAVSSTTLTAGTEGYGICVYQVKATTGTFRSAGFHNGGTLSATGNTTTSSTCDDATHQLDTGLTTSFQNILNSANSAVESGRGDVFVKAAISDTTEAHDDYTDTLTFRATATF